MPIDKIASALVCSPGCKARKQAQSLSRKRATEREHRTCKRCGAEIPADRKKGSLYCSHECYRGDANERWLGRQATYMRNYLYGLTPEAFARMLADQEGRCAICRTDDPGGKGGWHVDHDHETKAVRGLLCQRCNLGLGNFQDDVNRLQSAYDYLIGGESGRE